MKHTFDRDGVIALVDHAIASETHRVLYEDPSTAKAGLWLVGDQGVYLLSNGLPSLTTEDPARPQRCVYADQVNPVTMTFDAWWEAKRAGFGGDDGVEFLDAQDMLTALHDPTVEKLMLDIDEDTIAFVTVIFRT